MFSVPTVQRWLQDEEASAVAEFTLVFPVLFMMLLGVWDVGRGVWAGQKTISSSQIIADLLARESMVDDDEISQAILAGELAMMPFDTESYEVEIASIEFDEDDEVVVLWSETTDGVTLGDDLAEKAAGLGVEGDGVLVVRVSYDYVPDFSSGYFTVLEEIPLREVTFARGRRTAVVSREEE